MNNKTPYSANSRPRFNPALLNIALDCIGGLDKIAFVPAPPPQQGAMPGGTPMTDPAANAGMPPGGAGAMPPGAPPMDPAMMGEGGMPPPPGMPPMDPAAMGGGAPPMDPMAGMPMGPDGLPMAGMGQGAPTPEAPAPDGGSSGGDIKNQIKQVLEETGVIKAPKLKPDDHYNHLHSILQEVCKALGVKCPAYTPTEGEGKSKGAGGGSSGSSGGSKGTEKPAASQGQASTEALSNAGIDPIQGPDAGMFAPPMPTQQKAAQMNMNSVQLAYARLKGLK